MAPNEIFNRPRSIAYGEGNIYVADTYNNKVKKIDSNNNVTILAPNEVWVPDPQFGVLWGIAYNNGYVYVASKYTDNYDSLIKKIDSNDTVTTVAPDEDFWSASGVAYNNGYVYVADTNHCLIKRVDSNDNVTTLETGLDYDHVYGLAFDNKGTIYVTQSESNRLRKLTPIINVTIKSSMASYTYGDIPPTATSTLNGMHNDTLISTYRYGNSITPPQKVGMYVISETSRIVKNGIDVTHHHNITFDKGFFIVLPRKVKIQPKIIGTTVSYVAKGLRVGDTIDKIVFKYGTKNKTPTESGKHIVYVKKIVIKDYRGVVVTSNYQPAFYTAILKI